MDAVEAQPNDRNQDEHPGHPRHLEADAQITGTLRISGNVATIEDARIIAQDEIARADDTHGMVDRAGGR